VQIGVDIGGTFTDIVALDNNGRLALAKVPSTPKDLLDGIAAATTRVLALAGAAPGAVERFIHGTTIATNAILEQKGATTAILTTEGFEDVLELGRMKRSRMYDLDMDPEVPTYLAPRRRRLGIRERLDAKGRVLLPLHEEDVRAAVTSLRAQGVSAIAVCYLFSFVNPAHERRTREIVAKLAPEISVSLSSEVDPTFRESERICVTAFDAYRGPVVKSYLAGLADTLRSLGVPGVPLIMRSRGGIVSAALAAQQPVTLFLSGPAGGVIGAGFAAERSGVRDFVSLDMGGTSNDVAMVREGKALLASEGSIGPYPVRTPMVDVNTIGAGGGSIAWIDAAGGLRVGPRSAGAEPGPACYGRGGDEATVTDASVVLGYLNPARFAGGAMTLQARTDVADLSGVNRCLGELDAAGRARMREEGVPAHDVRVAYAADMRYVGQAYELEVPLAVPVTPESVPELVSAFHAVHARVYGYARAQQPVEFVNFRAVHTYPLPRPVVTPAARSNGTLADARLAERRAYFGGFVSTAIYERARLPLGARLAGPAIVEQSDTTTVIPPGVTALVDDAGNLRLRKS